MKWFKHDANAHTDDKLQTILMRYGAEGYALYWYCIELIAARVAPDNISFELKHDAEVIGYHLKIDTLRVEKIMVDMINLGLFECSGDRITCLKLAKRLDNTMTQNKEIKETLSNFKKLAPEEKRREEIRKENTKTITQSPKCPYQDIVNVYHETLPELPEVKVLSDKRKTYLKARWLGSDAAQEVGWWKSYFQKVSQSDFLMGRTDNKFQANFEWLITESNFIKVLEGNYERG